MTLAMMIHLWYQWRWRGLPGTARLRDHTSKSTLDPGADPMFYPADFAPHLGECFQRGECFLPWWMFFNMVNVFHHGQCFSSWWMLAQWEESNMDSIVNCTNRWSLYCHSEKCIDHISAYLSPIAMCKYISLPPIGIFYEIVYQVFVNP